LRGSCNLWSCDLTYQLISTPKLQDIDINDIAASSDAIVLAAGATKPRDLPIDGR